jgi:hypothetical protein
METLRQYRKTEEIAPKRFNGGAKLKLTLAQVRILADLIEPLLAVIVCARAVKSS